MADIAHELTDKELEKMERHLSSIYSRAEKELQEKADAYFKRFEELDAKKRELVDAGKITEREYRQWRQNKIMTGRHWTAMKEQAAQELLQANRTAQDYINGRLPSIYTLNYNRTAESVSAAVRGYSFELVDASTVKNLATTDNTLLPYKYVDGKKDVRWNTQKVNSEVLQGILQGDSIPNLAKRLQNVTEMNRVSAIRNARTTVTSAENKGRMDMLHDAADKGVITHKVWMATHDSRVREAHADLDGQEQEIDEPFESELGPIMYPGDPEASPEMVYNCRCTLVYKIKSFLSKGESKISPIQFVDGEEASQYFGQKPSREIRRTDKEKYDKLRKEYEGSVYYTWSEKLTGEQVSSIGSYSGDAYSGINGLLRREMTEKMVDAWNATEQISVQNMIKNIDEAIGQFELKDPIKVFRTCEKDVLDNLKLKVGSSFHDDGFVSTSVLSEKVASGNVVMQINVPSGKGFGAWINPMSGAQDEEYEFLLQRGSDFIVRGIKERGEDIIVELDLVGQTKSQWEYATREDVIEMWKRRGIYDKETAKKI